ncbi:hypothetical protein J8F10_18495 [Gemmata sp. G18]|uniref:Cyanovirin-N domain-containing protein n=1 Tax=Gemmata palustris TaxID=2822762 RepID=A0ABS5BUC3_9BACT|nr:hypothetical protein [Gemmata palustris]MBP3957255.1 hypothetical protein [Gemmata palustris]
MRKLACMVAFGFATTLVLAIAAIANPTCDGTKPKSIVCDGTVPAGYYQSSQCQGDLSHNGACLNAIAFNIEYFGCTSPAVDPATGQYISYCADSVASQECTQKRICVGETKTKGDGTLYTNCSQKGEIVITKRLVKEDLGREGASVNIKCAVIVVAPPPPPPPAAP